MKRKLFYSATIKTWFGVTVVSGWAEFYEMPSILELEEMAKRGIRFVRVVQIISMTEFSEPDFKCLVKND